MAQVSILKPLNLFSVRSASHELDEKLAYLLFVHSSSVKKGRHCNMLLDGF